MHISPDDSMFKGSHMKAIMEGEETFEKIGLSGAKHAESQIEKRRFRKETPEFR